MVTVILKSYAAPGNIDSYGNVALAGASNTNTGTRATDLANFQTGAAAAVTSSASLLLISYTDTNGSVQTKLISVTDIKTVE